MDPIATNRRGESRSGRAVGVALSLSLHAGVAWAAWIGLAEPEIIDPVPIAVRFIEVAPPMAEQAAPGHEPAPAQPPVEAVALAAEPSPPPQSAAAEQDPLPKAETPTAMPQVEKPRKPEPPKKAEAHRPPRRAAKPSRPVARAEPPPVARGSPVPPALDAKPARDLRETAPAPVPAPHPDSRNSPSPPVERTAGPGTPQALAPGVATAAPTSAPRFDAAYLHNPAPAYPRASRRLGEEGRVVLRVRVEADGRASQLEVQRSSGSPRLDEAALDAVRRWSFVAARRGDEKVAAWVLVPMEFRLNDS